MTAARAVRPDAADGQTGCRGRRWRDRSARQTGRWKRKGTRAFLKESSAKNLVNYTIKCNT